ncbi:MAG: HypC/HybG/HupF family hydrogenase formation chaperone [Lentisphaeria bacterium]|jgi:hydrogenase expression/formation protein HypC|nr:HypC/HybG/HupF family hydrogenase formation chaperone [Lentisphaeria bacterium]
MCVGLSARVVSVKGGSAVIDASGARRTVSAELLDELEPGDYVMVHAGIAIAKITNSSEEESSQIMEQLDEDAKRDN